MSFVYIAARIPVASGRSRDHLARIGSAAQRHANDVAMTGGHVSRSQTVGVVDGPHVGMTTDLIHGATAASDPRRLRDPSSRTDRRKYTMPSSSRV